MGSGSGSGSAADQRRRCNITVSPALACPSTAARAPSAVRQRLRQATQPTRLRRSLIARHTEAAFGSLPPRQQPSTQL